ARLDADPNARRKVTALRLGAELVRERDVDLGIADGIADAVMARIASGDLPEVSDRDAAVPPPKPAEPAPAKVVPLAPRPKPAAPEPPVRPAANDKPPRLRSGESARRIYYLAAAAVAAAAALMVWGRTDPAPAPQPVAVQTAVAPPVAPAPPESAVAARADDSP